MWQDFNSAQTVWESLQLLLVSIPLAVSFGWSLARGRFRWFMIPFVACINTVCMFWMFFFSSVFGLLNTRFIRLYERKGMFFQGVRTILEYTINAGLIVMTLVTDGLLKILPILEQPYRAP